MNDRIKELYNQTSNETADGKEWAIGGLQNAERFAEVIVGEWLSVIEEMNPHDPERDIDDIFDEVKQHFGVEE